MGGRNPLSRVVLAVIRGHYSSQNLSHLAGLVISRCKTHDAGRGSANQDLDDSFGDTRISQNQENNRANRVEANPSNSNDFFSDRSSVERITRPVKVVNQFRFASSSRQDASKTSEVTKHQENLQQRDRFNGSGVQRDRLVPHKIWKSSLEKDPEVRSQPQSGPDLLDVENDLWTERLQRQAESLPGLGKRGKRPGKHHQRDTPTLKGEMLFGLHPVSLALKLRRRQAHCLYVQDRGSNPQSDTVDEVMSLCEELQVPMKFLTRAQMDQCSSYRPHQGVCLDASPLSACPYSSEDWKSSKIEEEQRGNRLPLWLVLNQVQDPMNFGAILRSAYMFGVNRVLQTHQNSCSLTPVVSKASTGVMEVQHIYSIQEHMTDFIQAHQQLGWSVIGTSSQRSSSGDPGMETPVAECTDVLKCPAVLPIPVQDFLFDRPTILMLGNEGSGLPEDILRRCDQVVYVDVVKKDSHQYGLDSLNVSVATGILLHCLTVMKGTASHR